MVFGGSKLVWDVVYVYGKKGIYVDWVIWESGYGVVWMVLFYVILLKKWLEKLVSMCFWLIIFFLCIIVLML